MRRQATREAIVEAADDLFYRHGYEQTSFADIADAVQISRGNFYYYFKTKDDILAAVIERRRQTTAAMLERWASEVDDPAARIRSFINILIANRAKIMRHGCPVGTLCAELAKRQHAAQDDASQLFTLFRSWLSQQFAQLGRGADADALAMHLLGRSQGVATLAAAFHDEAFVRREADQMCDWLRAQIAEGAAGRRPA
jgi:AcrR family transcriptional regulator